VRQHRVACLSIIHAKVDLHICIQVYVVNVLCVCVCICARIVYPCSMSVSLDTLKCHISKSTIWTIFRIYELYYFESE